MAKQIGEIKRKPHGMSFGSFFFGTFIGLLLGIGAIVGIGVFAYFNVSPEWINNTFHTNLDLGNENTNKLTLNTVVIHALNLVQNMDSYTINDLKTDFGIILEDKYMGIDITDLKNVPLTKLMEKLQDKLSNISAYELREVLGNFAILDKEMTYYAYGSGENRKLYKDADHTKPVEFDYALTGNKVTIKGSSFSIIEEEVKIALKYLPLTRAIADYTSELGDNVTLRDLHDNYGVELPAYIYIGNEDKTVNEITNIINSVTIAEIMNYKYDITVGYYLDKNNNNRYDEGIDEVASPLLNAIADSTVNSLNDRIKTLKVKDLFTDTTGALSLIPADTEINNISSAFSKAIQETSIGELIEKQVIDRPNNYDAVKNKFTNVDDPTTGGKKTIAKCTITELLNDYFTAISSM